MRFDYYRLNHLSKNIRFPSLINLSFLLFLLLNNNLAMGTVTPPSPKNIKSIEKLTIASGNKNAHKGGSLYYTAYEPNHLNPITYRDSGAREILDQWVFESLLDFDVATHQPIPRIARSWRISDDGKIFNFKLDTRAKWADRKPVTIEDVRFSFEVFAIKGVKALSRKASLNKFSKIEVLDKETIRFTAMETLFKNFYFLAKTLIVPRHLYYYDNVKKINKNKYTKKPMGSGPYYVKKWTKGKKCVLIKNPKYWGASLPQNIGAYNFDKIVIKYIRDRQIAFEMLKKGKLDYMRLWIDHWRQAGDVVKNKKAKFNTIAMDNKQPQGFGYIGFNLDKPLFKDLNLRKALYHLINKKEMINKNLDGLAVIPRGPLYSVRDYEGSFNPPIYNPKKAQQMLAKSGWQDRNGDYILDKKGKKLVFTLIVANSKILKEALFIQEGMKKVGVDMKVKLVEWNTFVKLLNEGKFDAFANGKSRKILVDPYFQFHSDNIGANKSNYLHYKNPKVDSLIELGRKIMDKQKRKKIFTQVNDIIANDYVIAQWSEIKYTFLAISKNINLPKYDKKPYYPYNLGMKYWYFK